MRLWLNRSAEISLREQLITQVVLGILTRELLPGHKLPSTRELARRFGIHPNTASACYRELERDGWLEFRHGAGVFVANARPSTPLTPETAIDQLIGELAVKARKIGAPDALLRARLRRWLALEPPARWLVIEPDPELRSIVIHEMGQALALPVTGCAPGECGKAELVDGAIAAVLPSKAAAVRKLLPAGTELTVLPVRPVAPSMERWLPAPPGVLVGIASRWEEFQRVARTMLIAAGLAPESLIVCDARHAGWKRGLEATVGVVCDSLTATELPRGVFALRYALLDDAALNDLRKLEQRDASMAG